MRHFCLKFALLAFTAFNLTACYHADIDQGNDLISADIQKLKLGISREAVIHIMGSPLLTPTFKNQLTYVYYYYPKHGHVIQQHVTLYFKNDQLTAIKASAL